MGSPGKDENQTHQNDTVDGFLRALRRRWWVVIMCAALGGLSAVVLYERQPTEYTATAALLFRDAGSDQLLGNSVGQPTVDPTREAATDLELASLPELRTRTAASLQLSPADVNVAVTAVGQSNVAQIVATDPNPSRAALIANTYAQQSVRFRRQADQAKVAGALALVQGELKALPASERYTSAGQSLQSRASQLQLLSTLQTGNAEIVQSAGVPTSPSSASTKKTGILGVLLGLLIGIGLAVLADRVDRKIREPSELEEEYGVPLLGAVPIQPAVSRTGTELTWTAPSDAFELLRARMHYFNLDRDLRSLLITSPAPREGKSTVALNLCIAEATAGRRNVVLVEADLRNSSLADRLGIRSTPGLAEVLAHEVTLDKAVTNVVISRGEGSNSNLPSAGFAVLTAGTVHTNPSELLERAGAADLLSNLIERFDVVVIDSPPISLVPDAIPLMNIVSGIVVVGRMDMTTRDRVRQLHSELTNLGAPVIGVVATTQDPARHLYGEDPRPIAPPVIDVTANPAEETSAREHAAGNGRRKTATARKTATPPPEERDPTAAGANAVEAGPRSRHRDPARHLYGEDPRPIAPPVIDVTANPAEETSAREHAAGNGRRKTATARKTATPPPEERDPTAAGANAVEAGPRSRHRDPARHLYGEDPRPIAPPVIDVTANPAEETSAREHAAGNGRRKTATARKTATPPPEERDPTAAGANAVEAGPRSRHRDPARHLYGEDPRPIAPPVIDVTANPAEETSAREHAAGNGRRKTATARKTATPPPEERDPTAAGANAVEAGPRSRHRDPARHLYGEDPRPIAPPVIDVTANPAEETSAREHAAGNGRRKTATARKTATPPPEERDPTAAGANAVEAGPRSRASRPGPSPVRGGSEADRAARDRRDGESRGRDVGARARGRERPAEDGDGPEDRDATARRA